MNISSYDLNRVKALHHLLEEAHVGRAASRLGITAAAASNALRRLREDLGDPLLVKRGRGLVRTRLGEELRGRANEVMSSAQSLLQAARPFLSTAYEGELPIALAEHVAAMLLPRLDDLVRHRAPRAILTISTIPLDVDDWLKKSGGVLVGPSGPLAAFHTGDPLHWEDFYRERYVCVMRRGHRASQVPLTLQLYAEQQHLLVTPRGISSRSDVDMLLASQGLERRVVRTVPSFHLAVPLLLATDLVTAMPERTARTLAHGELAIREMPFKSPILEMKLVSHPAHVQDGRNRFTRQLLRDALSALQAD